MKEKKKFVIPDQIPGTKKYKANFTYSQIVIGIYCFCILAILIFIGLNLLTR